MKDKLLRYEIDSWDEIVECKSNTSKDLYLTYDEVLDTQLTGSIVRVNHKRFGCLFAYLVQGSGPLLTEQPNSVMFELTCDKILSELRKYGFLVQFSKPFVINDDQFNLLVTADGLGMDKIRILDVAKYAGSEEHTSYLVAFNIVSAPDLLDNVKTCNEKEFSFYLTKAGVVNLSNSVGGLYAPNNWSFLHDSVLSIKDVLKAAR